MRLSRFVATLVLTLVAALLPAVLPQPAVAVTKKDFTLGTKRTDDSDGRAVIKARIVVKRGAVRLQGKIKDQCPADGEFAKVDLYVKAEDGTLYIDAPGGEDRRGCDAKGWKKFFLEYKSAGPSFQVVYAMVRVEEWRGSEPVERAQRIFRP